MQFSPKRVSPHKLFSETQSCLQAPPGQGPVAPVCGVCAGGPASWAQAMGSLLQGTGTTQLQDKRRVPYTNLQPHVTQLLLPWGGLALGSPCPRALGPAGLGTGAPR